MICENNSEEAPINEKKRASMVQNVIEKTEISPDMLAKHIRTIKAEFEQVLIEKEQSLKNAPEGKIRFVKKGNSIQYHHKHDHSVPEGTYLKREQDSLAAALAQKDYDCRLIRELKAEIKVLDRALADYRPERIDAIYSSLHACRKPLIRPLRLPDEEFVRRWIKVEYEKKAFEKNAPEYYTAKGERVRSKSEILIADALSRHNVPYRYEYPIQIRGLGLIYPDFFCLNARKRQAYVWEHNGMMSDSGYADCATNKIEKYALSGYFPGENLILSFESSSHPLNSRAIARNINRYLL